MKSLAEAQRQRRAVLKAQVKELVVELGSYSAAANQVGMTRQAVHFLVGPGLADGRSVTATCVDCGYEVAVQGSVDEPRCRRCKTYLRRTNHRWSVERVTRSRRLTHCKRGHPLDEDNVYVTPAGKRECRICITIRLDRHQAKQRRRKTDCTQS